MLRLGGAEFSVGSRDDEDARLPMWISPVFALECIAATSPDRGKGAGTTELNSLQLLEEILPRLQRDGMMVSLRMYSSGEEMIVAPDDFASDVRRQLAIPPKPKAPAQPKRAIGVGQQLLNRFIAERLAPALKARGFQKAGNQWYLRGNGVWGLVVIQRDKWNEGDTCKITINLQVISDRLRYFHGELNVNKRPSWGDPSAWGRRLGEFIPPGEDRWWTFSSRSDAAQVEQEIEAALLGPAMAYLRELRSDEAMRDCALREYVAGGQAKIALAVLLHDLGPREELGAVMDSIRANASARGWHYGEVLLHRVTDQDRSSFG